MRVVVRRLTIMINARFVIVKVAVSFFRALMLVVVRFLAAMHNPLLVVVIMRMPTTLHPIMFVVMRMRGLFLFFGAGRPILINLVFPGSNNFALDCSHLIGGIFARVPFLMNIVPGSADLFFVIEFVFFILLVSEVLCLSGSAFSICRAHILTLADCLEFTNELFPRLVFIGH